MPQIFLIEDEEILSWCMEMELKALGFEVKVAQTVKAARELFHTQLPDLLICDQGLPDGRGSDLIKFFRALGPRIPIIIITAFTPPSHLELDAIGAVVCLRKPFDLDFLAAEICQKFTNA